MPRPARRSLRLLVAAVLLIAAATGCGSDSTTPSADASPSASQTPGADASSALPSPTSSTAPPPSSADVPAITVAGGEVDGPSRVKVTVGDKVAISVTSDTRDEVHVHGYDVTFAVRPGRATIVRLRADIPGVFEVELEDSHLLLTQLRVTQ